MKKWTGLLAGLALLALGSTYVQGVNMPLFSGPACSEPSQTLACLNQIITQYNQQLGAVPTPSTPRNLIDNGAFNIQQRGTSAQTCATTSAPTTSNYGPDRWFCDVNVTSGAGQLTVITATPSPPLGFAQSVKLVRNSGALTQPQCAWHILPTSKAVALQGQPVVFSVYQQALAGLAADQGSTTQSFNLVVLSGTSADESASVGWTASPAITIAFTGLATLVNTNFVTPVTPAWARYSTVANVPTTAKELAVGVCFTPTASGQSATDGIAFVGAQLEQGGVACTATSVNVGGLCPTAYEFKNIAAELVESQRYFQILTEPASGVQVGVTGNSTSATAAAMAYTFPVQFRAAPTFTALGTALSGSTWTNKCGNVNNALATTFIVTATANTVNNASLTVTSSGSTIGFGCVLVGAGGGSILSWSADL